MARTGEQEQSMINSVSQKFEVQTVLRHPLV